jgi:hypothetical protein
VNNVIFLILIVMQDKESGGYSIQTIVREQAMLFLNLWVWSTLHTLCMKYPFDIRINQ